MKTRNRWMLGAAALAVVLAVAWAFAPRPVAVEAAVASLGRFEQAIEEDGRTRIRDAYAVSAPVVARLGRIQLREGDRVAAGDPVAVLTPVMSSLQDERSVREAAARLGAAEAGITLAQARLERSQVARDEAQAKLRRSEQLAREGFLAAASLDVDRLALEAANRELAAAQAQREVAAQERAQAAAALQPASSASPARPLVLRAPVSGVVLRIPLHSEGTVAAGTTVLEIGEPRQMEVLAQLLTTDAVQALPGTRAVIERWGGPALEGRVRRVEPAAFTKVSALGIEEQRVNVLIDLSGPPAEWARVGDGFRVQVRLVTASADNALLVPVGALFPHAEGGMAVFRIDGGRSRIQPVELGGRNASVAWVRNGLAPGQQVVIYPPPGVTDGARVRVRAP